MNFTIQRFTKGHPFYSEASITNMDDKRGVVGTFKAVFGQMLDADGKFIHYTMERLDTLIPNGKYKYDLYDSPHNKCKVPRLIEDEKGVDISERELEHHVANYPYQLKGCCAHGLLIDLKLTALLHSRDAFNKLMEMIGNDEGGIITYENL